MQRSGGGTVLQMVAELPPPADVKRYPTELQAMPHTSMPTCPPMGPLDEDDSAQELPADWDGDPFALLPERYQLSAEELDLANRYRNNDISKGYIRSQIAAFRAPRPDSHHIQRQTRFAALKESLKATSYVLPKSFIRLCESDDFVNRIRHNNVWLHPVPTLVVLPNRTNSRAVQVFYEGQGCCHFSLLLHDDGTHSVLYHEEPIVDIVHEPYAVVDDLDSVEIFRCCDSFDRWLALYFLECKAHDENYASMLERFPGM